MSFCNFLMILSVIGVCVAPKSATDLVEEEGKAIGVVPSDHNCLFHALANQINSKKLMPGQGEQNHETIRKRAMKEIKENKELYRGYVKWISSDERNMDNYIKRMRKNKEWGDDAVMQAIAKSCKILIKVYYDYHKHGKSHGNIQHFGHEYCNTEAFGDESKRIEVIHVNGNHYNEVVKKEGKSEEKKEKRDDKTRTSDSTMISSICAAIVTVFVLILM